LLDGVRVNFASSSLATALGRLVCGQDLNCDNSESPADIIAEASLDSSLAALDAQSDINTRAANTATVADGVLQSVSGLLTDAQSLAVASAGNTLSDAEKQANQTQLDSILDSVNRLGSTANFNGQNLFDGTGQLVSSEDALDLPDLSTADIGKVSIDSASYALVDTGSGKSLNLVDGNAQGAAQAIGQALSDVQNISEQVGAFAQGAVASQATLLSSGIYVSQSIAEIQSSGAAMEMSIAIRAQLLAAGGNRAIGFAGAYPGGMLSLFA
jgi:flagellin